MVVRTQSDGRTVTGLYIGTRNARRNIPKRTKIIELQLGDIHIRCELPPEFWRGQPEIRDQRLCDWLDLRFFHGRSCRTPIPLVMFPAGKNAFRLHPLNLSQSSAIGMTKIGPAAANALPPTTKPPCTAAVCRTRQYISCPVSTASRFRSLESLA
jgi:hypothetical protein